MGAYNAGAPIGQGFIDRLGQRAPCVAGIFTNLTATYANGTAGQGATLTNSGALAAFPTQDGVTSVLNARYLVMGQSSALQNGIYTLTTLGTGAVAWVLTRATDADEPSELIAGMYVTVSNPIRPQIYVLTATVTTVGSTSVVFKALGSAKNIETLTDAATVTANVDVYAGGFLATLSQNTTFANPTGTPTSFQQYTLRVKSTSARTLTWGSQFRGSADLALPSATSGSSLTDYYGFQWNAADSKWDLLAKNAGF